MNYAKKVKTHEFPWKGRLVYTPFASKDMISLVGSVAGGRLGAQGFLETSKTLERGGDVLSDIHAAMLLEGTSKHPKKQLQEVLDSIGASLSFTAGADRLVFQASVRPVHLDVLLKLISEVLIDSTFPENELAIQKKRMMSDLALEKVDPKAQSRIHLSRALFPAGHASREDLSDESAKCVAACTRTMVRKYHGASISRSSLIVSIAGDIPFTEAQRKIASHFKKLPEAQVIPIQYVVASSTKGTLIKTPIPEKSSVEYTVGIATGMYDSHPDYQALMLGIQILGIPGFTGRLMNIVREREGLTYGVYASLSGSARIDGACLIKASFAPELYQKGRASVLREIKRLVEKGVSSLEVRKHIAMSFAQQ